MAIDGDTQPNGRTDGPKTGKTDVEYGFDFTVLPATNEKIYAYSIEVTDRATPITGAGDSTAGITFTWSEPGNKTVAVSVSNGVSTVKETHTIEVASSVVEPTETKIYLPVITR